MMKKISTNSLGIAFLALSMLALSGPVSAFAATAPDLGTAATYGVLSSTFTNSNTAPQTIVNGDVCYTTPPGTPPLTTVGLTTTPCASQTGLDQGTALSTINGQACTDLGAGPIALDTVVIPGHPAGTFPPGCYSTAGAMTITLSSTVTLDGAGVYVFRAGGALTTGANSNIALANGASASNVYWAPVAATTLGANAALSATPTFVGTILDAAGISIGHFANLLGRALAFGGTVTTDANTITVPTATATLRVVKLVVNASHTSVPSDFNVHVKNSLNAEVAGSPAPGAAAPGTTYSLPAGTYTVSEDAAPLYVRTFTGTGCDANGVATLAGGDDKTCTIVNTDIPLPAPVVPAAVYTTSGGGGVIPLIGILKVPSPIALPSGPGQVTYNYTVWNVGGSQPLVDISIADDKCSLVKFLSGDTNNNGKLDPYEKWYYSCTTSLAKTTTNTAVVTGHGDDSAHQAAFATAIATVVVSSPLPPPLISIVKVPSRLTPFPFGGGNVMYSYTVTNPGTVPVGNVVVTDDKCSPVSGPFGDTNRNNLLDPGEKWSYACQTFVRTSTRNTATAEGKANGFTALGYAFSDVLTAAPGLPNTGLPPIAFSPESANKGITRAQAIAAFHRSLGIGDEGEDVVSLQTALEKKGFLTIPAGVAKGYFGSLTRKALLKYQESSGLPTVGVFGPRTKAKLILELE